MADQLNTVDLVALERAVKNSHFAYPISPRDVLSLIQRVREAEYDRDVIAPAVKDDRADVFELNEHLRADIDALDLALSEALAEIAYWLPDYLEGGKYHEHPRGSGPDRVMKLGRAALARVHAMRLTEQSTSDKAGQAE